MADEVFDARTLDRVPWPDTADGAWARRVLEPVIASGSTAYVANVRAGQAVTVVDDVVLPLTVPAVRRGAADSYVASPTTQYVDYARREVELELSGQPALRAMSRPIVGAAGLVARATRLDDCVLANNWLVSTNLYPPIDRDQLRRVLAAVIGHWPDRAVVFRSVNDALTGPLLSDLASLGGCPVFSRQVWILDTSRDGYRRLPSFARDRALARKTAYRWQRLESAPDGIVDRLRSLYDALYLEKYSSLNPQFTNRFVRDAIEHGWLDVQALERDGRVDAAIGFFRRGNVMTTPFIGYETRAPVAEGLYRLISLRLVDEAVSSGSILHQSSGAAGFKRHRGARPATEYHVVFADHLPVRRRIGWHALAAAGRRVILPIVRRYNL